MKFFKKVKNFFVDDRHEEDEYYENYYEDEIEESFEKPTPQREKSKMRPFEQEDKSKFRFPLIDDENRANLEIDDEPFRERKKSAVFYDVEQDTGVKLPSHLPQQSLVYDVEVSNIAELLAKRNKSHGSGSIVRYDQQTLRPRSKGTVTTAEKKFLTANPQREDVVTPVVNREPTTMSKGKRFVPTQVPSPVHGFNKPKSIEELLPDLEVKQQEARKVAEESIEVKGNNINSDKLQSDIPQDEEQVQRVESIFASQAEQLAKQSVVEKPTVEKQDKDVIHERQVEGVTSSLAENKMADSVTAVQVSEQATFKEQKQPELDEQVATATMQTETTNGEKQLQELAVQHLTIENSTVHIEQLKVEQPAPIVQPTINIDATTAPIAQAKTTEQVPVAAMEKRDVVEPAESAQQVEPAEEIVSSNQTVSINDEQQVATTSASKGSRLPFNVIMLDSDKKKLKKPLAEYGAPTVPIINWQGNVIATPTVEQIEEQQAIIDSTSGADEATEQGGSPFLRGEHLVPTEVQPVPTMQSEVVADSTDELASMKDVNVVSVRDKEGQDGLSEASQRASGLKKVNEIAAELIAEASLEQANTATETDVEQHQKPVDISLNETQIEVPQQQEEQIILEQTNKVTSEQVEVPAPDQIVQTQPQVIATAVQEFAPVSTEVVPETIQLTEKTEVAVPKVVASPLATTIEQVPTKEEEASSLFEAYEKPPMDFLLPAEERTEDWAWLDEQAEYLIAALASHQVQAQIESIEQGPAVTQFEITVAQGTKVSKVRNLSDDIKLALAAKDIRIDAPIPGKRSIGIEIPNRVSRAVRLSEVTNSKGFIESDSPLEAALGLDLSGKPVTIDLRKMPHGLIAGATGSGKSVCINSILVSLLYKADPNELKLMLIDPKMVELAPFNQIPHLVSPVITDVKAATAALKWAVEEMERRYQLFMHAGVRDLTRYNQQAENARQFAQKLPYILIVIDELADLMMMAPADVEEAICRIAQKARACGIHLIVATQRPSVDVITGLIKSNIPTRIAFAVSSTIDSRTILDTQGAERLLGRGDMLYLGNGMQAPIRMQGTFVTDDEIEDIIAYVRNQGEPNYLFAQEDLIKRTEMFEEQDELFEEVCRFVYEQGTASTSSVQRHFHIGYNRAARLVDMLEKKGFVSEARGSKPRDVFINESDLDALFS